jgi:small subunit ribosomal protein S14
MAKKSKIAKNEQRKEIIERYAERRAELKKIINDPDASFDEKRAAYAAIAKMPRDASPTRYRNRCGVSGRPRGYFRKFGMSRVALRELAHKGELPGVRKASW